MVYGGQSAFVRSSGMCQQSDSEREAHLSARDVQVVGDTSAARGERVHISQQRAVVLVIRHGREHKLDEFWRRRNK